MAVTYGAKKQPKLGDVANLSHLEGVLTPFMEKVDPGNPNQIFAPEERGVPEVFVLEKPIKIVFDATSKDNTLEWRTSGNWEFGLATIGATVKGDYYKFPVDSEQAAAIFQTALENEGTVPDMWAVASMRARKPDQAGNPRQAIKVLKLYGSEAYKQANYIRFAKENGKLELENLEVLGFD